MADVVHVTESVRVPAAVAGIVTVAAELVAVTGWRVGLVEGA